MSFSGKYIAKMFSLKRFLVSKCILKLIFFVRVVRNQNQGYVSRKCRPVKSHAIRVSLTHSRSNSRSHAATLKSHANF